jgi:hypothetical protein
VGILRKKHRALEDDPGAEQAAKDVAKEKLDQAVDDSMHSLINKATGGKYPPALGSDSKNEQVQQRPFLLSPKKLSW